MQNEPAQPGYWTQSVAAMLAQLHSTANGLSAADAAQRLKQFGPNALQAKARATALVVFLNQFKNPLVLILIAAVIISALMHEWTDVAIILCIVLGSGILGFIQEYSAGNAVEKLRAQVKIKATVLRDGKRLAVPAEELVVGDVVVLSAGSLIPADGLVLEAKDLFVNQAVLTGETFPVEKVPGTAAADASLAARTNCVFMGTSVGSGTALALVTETGKSTAFGQIAQRLNLRPPMTEFERGILHYSYMLARVTAVMLIVVFFLNVLRHQEVVASLLFAVALAVGMAPELLPAIITVTLSKGAQLMAAQGVIVQRLNSIENLGSMDVLCTDKTGTLTEGVVKLDGAFDTHGQAGADVLRYAALNAHFQTGLANPLDEAIIAAGQQEKLDLAPYKKIDEVPYDFVRKLLTVVAQDAAGARTLITKGALDNVLKTCTQIQDGAAAVPLDQAHRDGIQKLYTDWSAQGFRVLGVAVKPAGTQTAFTRADEHDLVFSGFLLFFDPPKADAKQTIADLAKLGVQLKVITGDNRLVAAHIAQMVGMNVTGVLTGAELNDMRDEALLNVAERTSLFVEVDPNQKERIILALKKTQHVVGYMGDGINDAPALHAADVGISVDTAADVAKQAADFVLLKQDLDVLRRGIAEGRKTFANTIKYIFTTTSANFGNMFSMAGASLFLPFLPMLAKQILLENFLSDIPSMAMAGDNVDPEMVDLPHRWDTRFIGRFMIIFGMVSSVFDYLTFGVLLLFLHSSPAQFQTGWFVESLLTELAVSLVVRTRRVCFRSKPGKLLWMSSVVMGVLALAMPYLPFNTMLGFTPLPPLIMLTLVVITAAYVVATEVAKKYFYASAVGRGIVIQKVSTALAAR